MKYRDNTHKYWDYALNIIAGMLLVGGILLLGYIFIEHSLPMLGHL